MSTRPARFKFSTLQQVCRLIPGHLVSKLARKHGVDRKCRSYSPWSHVVTLLYAQLAHSTGLNDVCDGLRNHRGKLAAIRGATPPSRNGLSNANKARNANMAEDLFWAVLEHLTTVCPRFGGRQYRGFPHRFKRSIHVIDSSTIQLGNSNAILFRHYRSLATPKEAAAFWESTPAHLAELAE